MALGVPTLKHFRVYTQIESRLQSNNVYKTVRMLTNKVDSDQTSIKKHLTLEALITTSADDSLEYFFIVLQ